MPTREETISIANSILKNALAKYNNSLADAWVGIYEALLWYEPVGGGANLPHIIDANNLRPSGSGKASKKWIERANNFNNFLANKMSIPSNSVINHVDKLMKHNNFIGMQRQNSLGIAFTGLIKYLLEKFGNPSLVNEMEADATLLFPGQSLYGRTSKPRMDLISKKNNEIVAISSLKWSVRHDRLNDVTGECESYKNACKQLDIKIPKFFTITNEFSPSRLQKIINHPCIDGVVHVHKEAVVNVCKLDGRLAKLIDLVDFINSSYNW